MDDNQSLFRQLNERIDSGHGEPESKGGDAPSPDIIDILSKNPEIIDQMFDMEAGMAETCIGVSALADGLQHQFIEHAMRIVVEGEDHECPACAGKMLSRAEFFTQKNANEFVAYEQSVHAILHVMRTGMERERLELRPPLQFPEPDWSAVTDPDDDGQGELIEWTEMCAACGLNMDACPGHGDIGDYEGWRILDHHSKNNHSECNPDGCEYAKETQDG